MGEVVRIHDYVLRRNLERSAAQIMGELIKFAKSGGPIVDRWAGLHCPEGIEDLPKHFPDWDVG